MIEKYLIEHCSPTLASLKTANLFSLSLKTEENADVQILQWCRLLAPKGIALYVLRRTEKDLLIYVFRRSMLKADLQKPGVAEFLSEYGYAGTDPDQALQRLSARLACCSAFPHEIGIFLGYPLDDVKGFITYGGRNCKCSGCWQAYGNEQEAQRTFKKFNKCRAVYKKHWLAGRSVLQLAVAVS